MANLSVVSMNAGYITPKIDTRSDVEKYSAGCRILENMLPLLYGPVERRPGTEYIATGKNTPEGIRLIPFIYSSTISYMIEFGDLYARFYYDGARVLDGVEIVEVVTPYLVADLPQLQYKQSADVMWLVHTSYPPYKLSRVSASEFSLDKIAFTNGPFLERNDIAVEDDVTMTSSVTTADTIGTLTASVATFEAGHIGSLWKLTHKREDTSLKGSRTTVGVIADETTADESIDVKGSWTVTTHGNWGMSFEIQRNEDGTNWETFRSYTSVLTGGQGSRNIQKTDIEETDGVQYRMYVTAVDAPAGTIEADFVVNDPVLEGIVRVDNITSPLVAVITVLSKVASTDATKRWAEGAWSGVQGYPTSFTFFEERAVYAGSTNNARRVWFSKTGKFENFEAGDKDADAFELDLPTANSIRWVASLDALIIGTSGDEWRIRSTSIDAALTPTNFDIRQQTARGCRNIQALEVNEAVLFVDFVGRKIREMTYSDERQKFMSPDLTALAEDITEGGITSLAHQRNPDSIVWGTVDGTLLSMTYEREQNVVAWAKHLIGITNVDSTTVDTTTTEAAHYPILRELTADEIPDKPVEPADTVLSGALAVTNYDELQAMSGAGHYSISNDIDLTGETWTPIADFSGVLEGNGHTISNLSLSAPASNYQAIFSSVASGCEIRDLNFKDCSVSGKYGTAILISKMHNQSGMKFSDITFTDCTVTGAIGQTACLIAGPIIGVGSHAVTDTHIWRCSTNNCTVTATLFGGSAASLISYLLADGGAVNIVDCYANGGSVVSVVAGGLLGNTPGSNAGGVMTIHSCWSSVDFTESSQAVTHIGGFIRSFGGGSIISCYSDCNITLTTAGKSIEGGGFIDHLSAQTEATKIIDCNAACTMVAPKFRRYGGFFGAIEPNDVGDVTITRCYATGSMTSNNMVSGSANLGNAGFVGFLQLRPTAGNGTVTIERCWTTVDITITGNTTGTINNVGGFSGRTELKYSDGDPDTDFIIRNCYTWSSITNDGKGYIGGFTGYEEDDGDAGHSGVQKINCYSAQTNSKYGSSLTDQIVGDHDNSEVNAFLGFNESGDNWPVTECFWDNETSDVDNDSKADWPDVRTPLASVGHTTEWMMTESNYEDADWDMDVIWDMERATNYVQMEATGSVESVAVIPGEDEDEVWLAVLRDVDGTDTRFIERMKPRRFGDLEDAFFVDCGLSYDGDATDTFSGLDHLEGETVSILGDGAVYADEVVIDGSVTINNEVEKAHIGLPFEYKVSPMRLDVTTQAGATLGSIKNISELSISFLETLNARYGDGTDDYEIDWRTTEVYGSPPALFTGMKTAAFDGGFSTEDTIIVSGRDPMPATVRAITLRIRKTGR